MQCMICLCSTRISTTRSPPGGPYPVESVIGLMDNTGGAMGLVSSAPDAGTIMRWNTLPTGW